MGCVLRSLAQRNHPPTFGTRTGVECSKNTRDHVSTRRAAVARMDLASLAQLVEQCFRKAEVPGSNPGTGSIQKLPIKGVFGFYKRIFLPT